MTVFFSDNFDGTGPLDAGKWINVRSLARSGGAAMATSLGPFYPNNAQFYDPEDPEAGIMWDGGHAFCDPALIPSGVMTCDATLTITTGSDINAEYFQTLIDFGFTVGGRYYAFKVRTNGASSFSSGYDVGWVISCGESTAQITLAPNTEYTAVFHVQDGLQTVSFAGVTVADTDAYTTTDGLSEIFLVVGAGNPVTDSPTGRLESISVASESASTGGYSYIAAPMCELASFSGGFADIAAPVGELDASGSEGSFAYIVAPMAELDASGSEGGFADIAAPSPKLFSRAHSSAGENGFSYTTMIQAVSAFGGAACKIEAPIQILSIEATVTGYGAASMVPPAPVVVAIGTVSTLGSADIRPPTPSIVGYSGAVIDITLQGGVQINATGLTGAIGRATITLPLFELSATGTMENYGGADLLAPMPGLGGQGQAWIQPVMAFIEAIGTATVAATFEAYAVNLQHTADADGVTVDEVTRYTNFPFTHVVRYRNSYFGANSTGLYLLEGTTDAGAAIPYEIETHPDTFGHTGMKTAVSAYFSGRIDPEMTAKVIAGQDAPQTYSYTSPRGATAQAHRVKFGRGVKDRYLAVGLAGNGVLELDEIELEIEKLKRRI